jgi:hypothetical protein
MQGDKIRELSVDVASLGATIGATSAVCQTDAADSDMSLPVTGTLQPQSSLSSTCARSMHFLCHTVQDAWHCSFTVTRERRLSLHTLFIA